MKHSKLPLELRLIIYNYRIKWYRLAFFYRIIFCKATNKGAVVDTNRDIEALIDLNKSEKFNLETGYKSKFTIKDIPKIESEMDQHDKYIDISLLYPFLLNVKSDYSIYKPKPEIISEYLHYSNFKPNPRPGIVLYKLFSSGNIS